MPRFHIGQQIEVDLFGLPIFDAMASRTGTVVALDPGAITVRLHAPAAAAEVTVSERRVLRALPV